MPEASPVRLKKPWLHALHATFIATSLFVTLACFRTIPQSAQGRGGAWTIQLMEVREGPNSYQLSSGLVFVPGAGNDFLWFLLRVTNDTEQDRRFGWKRCSLPRLEGAYVTGVVTPNSIINQALDEVEVIKAHQSIERRIGIAYPKGTKPTQLQCGEIALPLKF
jgi:hypothetical protein